MSLFARNKGRDLRRRASISVREMCIFSMLAALMFSSKLIMELLPNVHLLGMFVCVCAVVFRSKGLIPIYIFVLISGIYYGFATWWLAYLYIWAVLFFAVMLIPKRISPRAASVVYPIVCALHGALYGVLYAPTQALLYGFDFKQTVAWIISGLPFDLIHGVSNLFVGTLILPFSILLRRLLNSKGRY